MFQQITGSSDSDDRHGWLKATVSVNPVGRRGPPVAIKVHPRLIQRLTAQTSTSSLATLAVFGFLPVFNGIPGGVLYVQDSGEEIICPWSTRSDGSDTARVT
jgi:hypothetical protein